MGYLLIDNSVSGGLKEEYDTKRCPHCGGIVQIPTADRRLGGQALRGDHVQHGFCRKCMAPLCKRCTTETAKFGCKPFMEKLVAQMKQRQARKRFLEDVGT